MHPLLYYPLISTAAYLSLTLVFALLHLALPSVQILGFIFRCLATYFVFAVCAVYGTISSLILRIFDLHYKYAQYTTARAFKWTSIYAIGVSFDISPHDAAVLSSVPAKGPYVLVANHQTELDILFLGWIWPQSCSVTAKRSLAYVPFLGWFMSLSGAIFIDRFDRTRALKAFEGAAKVMRERKQSVLIFPEGTRSYSDSPKLLPFKKGAFHLALQAGADILPVVAENYSWLLNAKARRFNSGTIRVKVLDPIPTKGLTTADVSKLTEDTREKMLAALNQMAEEHQQQQQQRAQAAEAGATTGAGTSKKPNGKLAVKQHIS